mmetsp:Transcript_14538/g.29265  ORF Transcript_14538/g.29265 Transcript_14538/m.29265 type:complete len:102 (+) Transcript_14538:681-986(+)
MQLAGGRARRDVCVTSIEARSIESDKQISPLLKCLSACSEGRKIGGGERIGSEEGGQRLVVNQDFLQGEYVKREKEYGREGETRLRKNSRSKIWTGGRSFI